MMRGSCSTKQLKACCARYLSLLHCVCLRGSHWPDDGERHLQEPFPIRYGRRIIEQMIDQLKGKTRSDWRAEGLVCEITLRV
jgi:hypothetical protein